MSEGIEHMGSPQWQIVLCLLAAWTLTFLALSKGVKSTGKVSTVKPVLSGNSKIDKAKVLKTDGRLM